MNIFYGRFDRNPAVLLRKTGRWLMQYAIYNETRNVVIFLLPNKGILATRAEYIKMEMNAMKKKYYSVKSILGGSDFYDENGRFVGHSVPGIGGGEDFFVVNGETGYSIDSVFGGQDFYGSNGTRAYSVRNPLGGEDIHGDISGYTIDSPFGGGSDIFLDDNHTEP